MQDARNEDIEIEGAIDSARIRLSVLEREGKIKCNVCEGKGKIYQSTVNDDRQHLKTWICFKCHGTGYEPIEDVNKEIQSLKENIKSNLKYYGKPY